MRLGLAVVGALGLVACSGPEEGWRAPDLVMISVDTLRADHLGVYGHDVPVSPHIDALAARSALFERAYTHAAHTLIAHASLLTGLYPEGHGAEPDERGLRTEVTTLAQALAAAGYRTAGFVNTIWLTPHFGMDRGFETFDAARILGGGRRTAAETNEAVFSWAERPDDRPYFLFVHFYDVHSDWDRLPYEAPPEYLERFAGPEPPGFDAGDEALGATRDLIRRIRENDLFVERDRRYVERLYDAGVAYTDAQVGRLIEGLYARGRLDHAIVVLTSDHGEEFQEHGRLVHTQVYEETVRVPLLLSMPEMRGGSSGCRDHPEGFRPSRIRHVVQHVDLLPSLIECLGLSAPSDLPGVSLLPALAGGELRREVAYFVSGTGPVLGAQSGILRDGWKLVELGSGGQQRLYDLGRDPSEQRDLATQHPERVNSLARELLRRRSADAIHRGAAGRVELTSEESEALRALGYLEEVEGRGTPQGEGLDAPR